MTGSLRPFLYVFVVALLAAVVFGVLRGRRAAEPQKPAAENTTGAPVDRSIEEAAAAHILIAHAESDPPLSGVTRSRTEARERALSISVMYLDKRGTFEDLAHRFSDDPNVERNAGYLGTFRRGQLPLALEIPLFDLEIGHVDPTVETPRGYHILLRQPIRRAVASHILVSWAGADGAPTGIRRTREQARILAGEVLAMCRSEGADFCELASRFSDDVESRFECGLVGRVQPATLPAAFEAELFSLRPGEISRVVETSFGFHIILRNA